MMTVKTRSQKDMEKLVQFVAVEATVEGGVKVMLEGLAGQLSAAIQREDSRSDLLALPNFASALKAAIAPLTAAVVEDVEPTKSQIDAASLELSTAKAQIAEQAKVAAKADPTPEEVKVEEARLAQLARDKEAQRQAQQQPAPAQIA